ncbi:hypothetical protein [Adhaeretor mobilis]|uniref:Uncharacterized protein n=1 Tax=Adhaeretor mobilis TaxID=1930276 RepID=A0A517MR72_9BACT|nr:hypothetical protein [Adhaeretor mobilis]QDS97378.1 hypothetical protein HG15A2_06390 [Adhaeretor mobilis]
MLSITTRSNSPETITVGRSFPRIRISAAFPCGSLVQVRNLSQLYRFILGNVPRLGVLCLVLSPALWFSQNANAQEPSDTEAEVTASDSSDSSDLKSDSSDLKSDSSDLKSDAPSGFSGVNTQADDAPPVYYLPDAEGKLRRVIGFRYEDFLELQGLHQKQHEEGVVLESLVVTGKVAGEVAELEVTLTVIKPDRIRQSLPIEFGSAILQDVVFPKVTQATEAQSNELENAVAFDSKQNAYVLWLSEQLVGRNEITLKLAHRIDRVAGQRRLSLPLPRAAKSKLTLDIEGQDVEVNATGMKVPSEQQATESGTRVTAAVAAGITEITWLPPTVVRDKQQRISAVLDVLAELEPDRIGYRCRFQAVTLGQLVETFKIQLPPGFELSEETADESFEVRRVEDRAADRMQIEIRFPAATAKPPIINFNLSRPVTGDKSTVEHRLSVPRVLEVYRQSGAIAVSTSDQLQSYYDLTGSIDQVAVSELPETLAGPNVTAAFLYAGTDGELLAHTQPRIERVRVRPEYQLAINSDECTLAVELNYQISSARLFTLRVDLQDWQLTEDLVESGGLVDRSRLHTNSDNVLILPLVNPAEDSVKVRFTLRRPLATGQNTLFLPEPLGAFNRPGKLTATSIAALRMTPSPSTTRGLTLSAAVPSSIEADRSFQGESDAPEDSSLSYNVYSGSAALGLVLTQRPGEIEAFSRTSVKLRESSVQLQQRLEYQMKYESKAFISLKVPRELWEAGKLNLYWDDLPLERNAISEPQPQEDQSASTNATDESHKPLQITLPRRVLGSGQLTMQYEDNLPAFTGDQPVKIDLLLAQPVDLQTGGVAEVTPASDYSVTLGNTTNGNHWTPASALAGNSPDIVLLNQGSAESLPLSVQQNSGRDAGILRLDRAWAQTWIVGSQRQDRFVYLLECTRPQVTVDLPVPLRGQAIEVLLNGQRVGNTRLTPGQMALDFKLSENQGRNTLELRTQRSASAGGWNTLTTEVPTIVGTTTTAPFYWQLVVPASQSLLRGPKEMVGEYRIGWRGYQWGRQPTQRQSDLENWTSASPLGQQPGAGSNEYVFASWRTPSFVSATVLPQLWIQLSTIAVLLGIGLASLYSSFWRSPLFWLIVSSVLLMLAFAWPQFAVMMIQGILIAGTLVAAAALLRRWLVLEMPQPASRQSSESIDIRTVSTDIWREPSHIDPAATVAPGSALPSSDLPTASMPPTNMPKSGIDP